MSKNTLEIVGSQFAVIIVAEYGNFASNYLITQIEADDIDIYHRDDFLKVQYNKKYTQAMNTYYQIVIVL